MGEEGADVPAEFAGDLGEEHAAVAGGLDDQPVAADGDCAGAVFAGGLGGAWLLVGPSGGFLATGWHGLILSLAVIMFSFGGLELIGITAAEAQNPEKSIPKAVNQVVYRILLFYIGSLVVLLALYPWVEIKSDSSPFVMIFHNLDSNLVASALNFVILVASLSVYNSGVYSNSRMLFGLSVQGNAPKFLARVSKRGVPVKFTAVSAMTRSIFSPDSTDAAVAEP